MLVEDKTRQYQLFMSRKKAQLSAEMLWFSPRTSWNCRTSTSRSFVPMQLRARANEPSTSPSTSIDDVCNPRESNEKDDFGEREYEISHLQ